MPLAPIDQQGTTLYYEDSGVPATSSPYVTLVIVHGCAFHGAIFKRLISFADQLNLRIICPNLRDYPGSTPYSSSELEVIRNGSHDAQAALLKARGLEIGAFLSWFIRTEYPPAISNTRVGEKSGGLSLISWSAGNCVTIPLFAYADMLPADYQELLSKYLRSYIIYDPAYCVMGVDVPSVDNISCPLQDTSVSPSELPAQFAKWASGYYHHDPLQASSFSTMSGMELLSQFAQHHLSPSSPTEQATIDRMSFETLAAVCDLEGGSRSHLPLLLNIGLEVYAQNLRAALVQNTLRSVEFKLVWCERSPPELAYSAWCLADIANKLDNARDVGMSTFEGANHFAHWDIPEKTIKFFAEIV